MLLHFFLQLVFCFTVFAQHEDRTLYLVPKTAISCLPADKSGPFRMTEEQISLVRPLNDSDGNTVYSNILAFPGCYKMNAQLEVIEKKTTDAVIMYHSFKWLRAVSQNDVGNINLGCTGADDYGCGGTGNGCYYCDICKDLKKFNDKLPPNEKFDAKCPDEVGVYTYSDERCIKDWGSFDKDKDGKLDFTKDEKYKDYAKFLDDLKIEGYGTVRVTIYLATNATETQAAEMASHRSTIIDKLTKSHGLTEAQAEKGWAKVHKVYWLPKLLAENLIACVNIFFDLCKHELIEDPKQLEGFQCPTNAG